ncbi:lipid-A-disaccharide synthase [Planctomycetes bacterium Pla163]|uniref:Lipid-A-disaccharide synthase n=1 Tax=Rohdeia mirabilis TaxID=2528008 RepID=A0A518CXX8_9BACT|nr:lipid-A-disaccharide synthase [Planctomycetes bacterium Pla163]
MNGWELLGWTGQALFFSRFLVQWLASEKAGRSVAPPIFWWISLVATVLLGLYSWGTGLPLFQMVFVINCAVYLRNVTLTFSSRTLPAPYAAVLAIVACGTLLRDVLRSDKYDFAGADGAWFVVGTVGAVAWASRFPLQWWLSERRGKSHFPRAFWWVSLVGNAALLAYAIHLERAVLIAGFSIGPLVQIRNLVLDARGRAERAHAATDEDTTEASGEPEFELEPGGGGRSGVQPSDRSTYAPPSPRK